MTSWTREPDPEESFHTEERHLGQNPPTGPERPVFDCLHQPEPSGPPAARGRKTPIKVLRLEKTKRNQEHLGRPGRVPGRPTATLSLSDWGDPDTSNYFHWLCGDSLQRHQLPPGCHRREKVLGHKGVGSDWTATIIIFSRRWIFHTHQLCWDEAASGGTMQVTRWCTTRAEDVCEEVKKRKEKMN